MIKILETKKVNLKFSDLEPGEVFYFDRIPYMVAYLMGGEAIELSTMNECNFEGEEIIHTIVTKYEYTHDKQ